MRIGIMNRKILQLTIPSIVSNITVPLLGLVDISIVGHLGDAVYIGAIAVGGMLFNVLFWLFGFLRMGTSGLTSQASGRKNEMEQVVILVQALGTGLFFALMILLFQYPIGRLAFYLLQTGDDVQRFAELYFHLCVWGVPAMLGMYAFNGWFIGMQNSRYPMFVAVGVAVVNVICSFTFVFLFGMKVEGVALGTLLAEWFGLALACWLWWRKYGALRFKLEWCHVWDIARLRCFFDVNKDIFLRTLCLVAVTFMFTSAGARQGDVVLAVNTLLLQFFTLFSYVMDGFAYAGEALVGYYVGAQDSFSLRVAVRSLLKWGVAMALLFTILYGGGGEIFLSLLTNEPAVLAVAGEYWTWVLLIPLASFCAFLWDGILIGATATRQMLMSMLVATIVFFVIYYAASAFLNNHVLWIAFLAYLFLRGMVQCFLGRRFFL